MVGRKTLGRMTLGREDGRAKAGRAKDSRTKHFHRLRLGVWIIWLQVFLLRNQLIFFH